MRSAYSKITAADIPLGPLAGTSLNVWAVRSGREHLKGCGRLWHSTRNIVRTIDIPDDAHADYICARLPDCEICMNGHPYLREVRQFLLRARAFDSIHHSFQHGVGLRTYALLLRTEHPAWARSVPEPMRPVTDRLLSFHHDLIARYADEVRAPTARSEVLAWLVNPDEPGRVRTPGKIAEPTDTGGWSLLVLTDQVANDQWWPLLKAQYWYATRSLDRALTALVIPQLLADSAHADAGSDSAVPSESLPVVGTLTDDEATNEFCTRFLGALPRFAFRLGPAVDAAWKTLDLAVVLDHVRWSAPATPACVSTTELERGTRFDEERLGDARDYLSDYLADEDWFDDDATVSWFSALGRHVAALPLSDPIVRAAAIYLQPFLDDDQRVDCAMYPAGRAVTYIERQAPGGDFGDYLTGFVDQLASDWRAWRDLVEHFGSKATWLGATVEGAQPD